MHIRNCFKHTLVAMIILLSSFSFLGCKKATEEAPAFYTPEVPIISTMKTWITDQKQYVSMSVQMRIDSLLATADWQKAMQTNVANGKSILYVPIRSSELGLEFFYDNKTKGIDSGNLVKVETKNSTLANTEIVAAKTYYETVILGKASTNPFTGTIHTYNIAANFIYDYKFDGGKIISHAIVAPIHHSQTLKKANGLKANAVVCEEWGMYLIWEYSPPTLVYTFLVCSGMPDCPPTSSLAISIGGGKQYVGVNCAAPPSNSGSPTGGGAPQAESCNFTSEEAQNLINSFEPESLPSNGKLVFGEEAYDPSTGRTEKYWNGTWNFFRAKLPGRFVIDYSAYYNGKVFKNNDADKWKFKSIKYLLWDQSSGILPTYLKIDMKVNNNRTEISQDPRNAYSEIHYQAILSLDCIVTQQIADPWQDTISNIWTIPD